MKLSFRIRRDIDHIFDYLTDMQKFASAHPVITRIEKTADGNYLVHETIKLGFVPFPFTYPVTIKKNATDKTVIFKATVFKFTKIEMKFSLRSGNEDTMIDEEIDFQSPLPVVFILERIFKKQHHQLFKNIEMK